MKTHPIYPTAICFLLIALVLLVTFKRDDARKISSLESLNTSLNDSLVYRKNKAGELVAERKAAEMRLKEFEAAMPKLADQIAQDFDIKLKSLKAYMRTEFIARGSGQAVITYPGATTTLGVWPLSANAGPAVIDISDGYLDLHIDVDSASSPYHYIYGDTLQTAFHTKQKWFLGRKTLYGAAKLSNPNAQIVNSQSILIKEYEDKRWGIGPFVGIGVTPDFDIKPTYGLSVQYSLYRF